MHLKAETQKRLNVSIKTIEVKRKKKNHMNKALKCIDYLKKNNLGGR